MENNLGTPTGAAPVADGVGGGVDDISLSGGTAPAGTTPPASNGGGQGDQGQGGGSNGQGDGAGGAGVNDGGKGGDGGDAKASDGSGKDDGKAGQGDQKVKTEPIIYSDFKLPEGANIPSDFIDGFKSFASAQGLNQQQAQAILDLQIQGQTNAAIAFDAVLQAQDAETRKVLGPDALNNLAYARKAVSKYGGDELRKFFSDNPLLGTNPLLMKAFIAIGKELAEDSMPDGATVNLADVSKMTTGDVLYGNMKL